jgi:hypothetical protein
MLRLILLAILPQIGGILLIIGAARVKLARGTSNLDAALRAVFLSAELTPSIWVAHDQRDRPARPCVTHGLVPRLQPTRLRTVVPTAHQQLSRRLAPSWCVS